MTARRLTLAAIVTATLAIPIGASHADYICVGAGGLGTHVNDGVFVCEQSPTPTTCQTGTATIYTGPVSPPAPYVDQRIYHTHCL